MSPAAVKAQLGDFNLTLADFREEVVVASAVDAVAPTTDDSDGHSQTVRSAAVNSVPKGWTWRDQSMPMLTEKALRVCPRRCFSNEVFRQRRRGFRSLGPAQLRCDWRCRKRCKHNRTKISRT